MIKLTKGVKVIFIANIILFALTYFLHYLKIPLIEDLVLYPITSNRSQIYQLFTYMFLHGSFAHIIFNMLGLLIFGPPIEQKFGTFRFINTYFLMGIVAGISYLIFITDPNSGAVGASGAVWGILALYALFNPNTLLYLYFLIPVRAKYAIGIFFLLELYLTITGANDGVCHVAHVGGALAGFLIYLYYKFREKSLI